MSGATTASSVDGKPLPERERTRLFLFHKPRGLVTTNADPEGRPTIFDVLPKDLPRVISVGRLDINTEGLLLLTNDGGLARVLELPATGWLRRYRVRAHGKVTQQALDGLRNGIDVDGVFYGAIEATLDREQGSNAWLTFAHARGQEPRGQEHPGRARPRGEPADPRVLRPVPARRPAGRRGGGGQDAACCASSSASGSRRWRAPISPGRWWSGTVSAPAATPARHPRRELREPPARSQGAATRAEARRRQAVAVSLRGAGARPPQDDGVRAASSGRRQARSQSADAQGWRSKFAAAAAGTSADRRASTKRAMTPTRHAAGRGAQPPVQTAGGQR